MEICGRRWLLLWFLRLLTGLNPSLTKVVPWQILVWNFLRDLIFPSRRLTIALRIMCSVNNVWIRHWGSLGISLCKVACTSWLAFPINIPNHWLLHQHPVYGYVSFSSLSVYSKAVSLSPNIPYYTRSSQDGALDTVILQMSCNNVPRIYLHGLFNALFSV